MYLHCIIVIVETVIHSFLKGGIYLQRVLMAGLDFYF